MSNAENREGHDERKKQADEGDERTHIERQPVPGHPENIPVDGRTGQRPSGDPTDGPVAGPVDETAAPTAEPSTKPGTPPGSQSERDRLRGSS